MSRRGGAMSPYERQMALFNNQPNANNGTHFGGGAFALSEAIKGFLTGRDNRKYREAADFRAEAEPMLYPGMGNDLGAPGTPGAAGGSAPGVGPQGFVMPSERIASQPDIAAFRTQMQKGKELAKNNPYIAEMIPQFGQVAYSLQQEQAAKAQAAERQKIEDQRYADEFGLKNKLFGLEEQRTRHSMRAEADKWSEPKTVYDENGQPQLVQYNQRGEPRVAPGGFMPEPKEAGSVGYEKDEDARIVSTLGHRFWSGETLPPDQQTALNLSVWRLTQPKTKIDKNGNEYTEPGIPEAQLRSMVMGGNTGGPGGPAVNTTQQGNNGTGAGGSGGLGAPQQTRAGGWEVFNSRVSSGAEFPGLYDAIIQAESSGNPNAVGPVTRTGQRAVGMMQLMPETAKEQAKLMNLPWSEELMREPHYNMALGKGYFDRMLQRYDGSVVLAMAAYNGGMRNVDKWVKSIGDPRTGQISFQDFISAIPFKETRGYVSKITNALLGGQSAADGGSSLPVTASAPTGFVKPGSLSERFRAPSSRPQEILGALQTPSNAGRADAGVPMGLRHGPDAAREVTPEQSDKRMASMAPPAERNILLPDAHKTTVTKTPEAQKKVDEAAGMKVAQIGALDQSIGTIEEIANDPNLLTEYAGGYTAEKFPRSQAAKLNRAIETVQSQVQLVLRAAMSGQGAISEGEAEPLKTILGKMYAGMPPEEILPVLENYKTWRNSLTPAQQAEVSGSVAPGSVPTGTAPAPVPTGTPPAAGQGTPPAPGRGTAPGGGLPLVNDMDSWNRLRSGQQFRDENGIVRTKP